jgi:hypothetical protein
MRTRRAAINNYSSPILIDMRCGALRLMSDEQLGMRNEQLGMSNGRMMTGGQIPPSHHPTIPPLLITHHSLLIDLGVFLKRKTRRPAMASIAERRAEGGKVTNRRRALRLAGNRRAGRRGDFPCGRSPRPKTKRRRAFGLRRVTAPSYSGLFR